MALIQDTWLGVLETVFDSGTRTALKGAAGVEILEIGGRNFVYVAGMDDSGLTVFELKDDGKLSLVSSYHDSAGLALGGAANISSAIVGGQTFLYVNGAVDSGITVFLVAADGRLSPVQTIFDDSTLNLGFTEGDMSVASSGGNQFLIATGQTDSGMSVFKINSDGTLTNSFNLGDNGNSALGGAYSTTTLTIGSSTFVFVAGYGDDGVSIFKLNSNGTLGLTDTIMDDGVLTLDDPGGMAAVTVDGQHYLFVGGEADDGITVLSISEDGEVLSRQSYFDDQSQSTNIRGVRDIQHFQQGGENYLLLTSFDDDLVSYARIGVNGTLTFSNVFDFAGPVGGAFSTDTIPFAGTTYFFTSGYLADGIFLSAVGGAATTLRGTGDADQMYGFGGDDFLLANDGDDLLDGGSQVDNLVGGAGNDTYIVDNIADVVQEEGNDPNDQVKASASFALRDFRGAIEILSTVNSAGTEAINLAGNALAQTITGNAGANILRDGGGAGDLLIGLGGSDTYQIYSALTTIQEAASQGAADRVMAAVDYALGASVQIEHMATNGSIGLSGIDLTGNGFGQEIVGNAGTNILDGKGGIDTLRGLGGNDFFVFSSGLATNNVDTIADYNATDDTIRLENAIFTALTVTGTLAASAFKDIVAAPKDASDRIIYNSDTGALYYDADGSGSGFGNVKFAVLTGSPTLTAADFVVI